MSQGSLDDLKRRILTRVPLPDLIGESVRLTPRSGRLVGLCPFHGEKNPSFTVYDDHYHCFGCKEWGDSISFIRKTQGLGYIDALRYLASRYSIEAPELDDPRRGRGEAPLYAMLAEAQDFYTTLLQTPHGEAARSYLAERGFAAAEQTSFGFGITPIEPFGLVRHLRAKGFRVEDMVSASLATGSTDGRKPYDQLRERITIPIRDPQGRVIAFGGRALDPANPAKYMNSRESPLFSKSHTLFGFDVARKAMASKRRAIIVEGYMDALQLRARGFPETVAALGTAFTEGHMRLLKQTAPVVFLLFDGDRAGEMATLKTVEVALTAPQVDVRVVRLGSEGAGDSQVKDPDDFIRTHGAAALEALLAKSTPLLDYAIGEKLRAAGRLAAPSLLTSEFVPWLAQVSDPLQRSFLAARIAQRTGISEDQVRHAVSQAAKARTHARAPASHQQRPSFPASAHEQPAVDAPAAPAPWPQLDSIEHEVLGFVYYARPGELDTATLRRDGQSELALPPPQRSVFLAMLDQLDRGESPSALAIGAWDDDLVSPELEALLARFTRARKSFEVARRPDAITRLMGERKRLAQRDALGALKGRLARLAVSNSPDREAEELALMREIDALRRGVPSPPAIVDEPRNDIDFDQ